MRTAHPREQLGNRLICDSLAISYSRDIDGTIAEEDEEDDDDDGDEDGDRAASRDIDDGEEEVGTDQQDDEDAMSNGHAALLEQVVIGGHETRRSTSQRGSRGKSRSVSPGTRAVGAGQVHDYVNSAPGSRFLEDTTRSIPAIPPPPQQHSRFQKQQQFFSVQPATTTTGDSDPYGKEFDAIGSRVPAANPPSTGSRINGRVIPPATRPEVRKELAAASIPPRLRNGFVPSSSGSGGV